MEENVLSIEELIEKNKSELFLELTEYLNDDNVTDIEWDGYNLWITKVGVGCYSVDKKLNTQFVNNLSIRLSNIMKIQFNAVKPILEAHTKDLRISIIHESRVNGVKSITIRKVPNNLRYNHNLMINKGMIPEKLLNFIENCVKAHLNIVIGGRPRAGKTELLKYLSGYIPKNEKVFVMEDNAEIHYREIHPNRKCVEFTVDDKITYADAIKASLRHDADWLLLSESRGPEVVELLNGLSTGLFCMTTIHLDEVSDIPDRMYNMLGNANQSDRFINNIYRYIDIGMVVKSDKYENRQLVELGFFDRRHISTIDNNNIEHIIEENTYIPFYNINTGIKDINVLPTKIRDMFEKYEISNPFEKSEVPEDVIYNNEGVENNE